MANLSPSLPAGEVPPQPPRTRQVWGWVIAAVVLLLYFAWAGSDPGTWPKTLTLWTFNKAGWIVPSRGLGQLLLAAALLYAALSPLAGRTLNGPAAHGIVKWIATALILLVSLELHFILLRAWWPVDFAGAANLGILPWRVTATVADIATLGLLLVALSARQKPLWLCALFAWHPVMLLAGPSAGGGVAWLLPFLVLAALPWRWHPWLRELLILTPAALSIWWIAHISLAGGGPINGLLAAALRDLGLEGRSQALSLIGTAVLVQLGIVILATKRRWEMARVWTHLLLVCILLSPRVDAALVLPLIALAPLCFVPAAWIMTGTFLALYLLNSAGGDLQGEWILFLVYSPVIVFEMADLVRRLKADPSPALSVAV